MATTAAQLMVQFSAQGADQVARDARALSKELQGAARGGGLLRTALGTGLGFLGAGLFQNAIGAVRGFTGGLIGSHAQAESLGMALEVAVGDRATQVFADLQRFAKETPFSFPELVQSTVNLENFGIRSTEIIGETGRTWTQIIGDTASAMGVSVDQVTQAVTDATMGENERLKELGIRATIEGDRIKYTYMKNGKEMTAFADRNSQEQIQAVVAGIWNDKYGGAMDRFKNSWQGQLSTLRDNWSMTLQRMTGGVFDWAKQGLKHANLFFDRFNRLLDRGLNPFQAGMKALKWTLQDILGKGAGNTVFAGIDFMVGGFQRLVRIGMDVARVVTGIGGVLGAAFFEGDRSRFFQMLPSWLRDSAGALGTIAEAFGDIWRTLREEGLGAALEDLFGGEGRQILGGLRRLAGEAWEGLKTAVGEIPWGDIWGTIEGLIGDAPEEAMDLGKRAISFAPTLASGIWGAAGDAWGWLRGKLGLNGGTVGDGTGGPETDRQPIPLGEATLSFTAELAKDIWGTAGDVTGWVTAKVREGWTNRVPIGEAVIDGTATLGEGLAGIAGNLRGWLQGKLFGATGDPNSGSPGQVANGGGSGVTVTLAQLAIDVLDGVAKVTAADIQGWIDEQLGTIGTIFGHVNSWGIILEGEPQVTTGGATGGGSGIGLDFIDRINTYLQEQADTYNGENGWAIDATNWILKVSGQPDAQVDDFNGWVTLIEDKIQLAIDDYGELKADLNDLVLKTPGIAALGIDLSFSTEELIKKIADLLPFPLNIPVRMGIDVILGDSDDGGGDGKASAPSPSVKRAIDNLFRQSFVNADAAAGYFNQVSGSMNTAPAEDAWLQEFLRPKPAGGALSLQEEVARSAPMKLPAPDTSAVDRALDGVKLKIAGLTKELPKAKLDADISPFTERLGLATKAAAAWEALTATATLDADIGPAAIAYTNASTFAEAWGAAIFTSTFDADNGPAAVAYTDAYGWGETWAGTTFTARFSVDLSPLENALVRTRQIVQEISDLLPRSPAKRGPLARPISFRYIGDSLRATMEGMARDTLDGMAAVSGALTGTGRARQGAAGLAAPRRDAPIIIVNAVKSDELQELIDGSRIGLRLGRNLSTQLQLLSQGVS